MDIVKKLLFLMSRREKIFLVTLIVFMIVGALLETIGISAIVPFVGLIADPNVVNKYKLLGRLRQVAPVQSYQQFIIFCGVGLVVFNLLKNILLSAIVYVQNKFSFVKYVNVSRRLLRVYLNQDYSYHLQRNSAQLINNLGLVGTIFQNAVLIPILTVATEFMVVFFIVAMLLVTEPVIALTAVGSLGAVTFLFYLYLKKTTRHLGEIQLQKSVEVVKWIQQSLGGIKEVMVFGKEDYFIEMYGKNVKEYTDSICKSQIIGSLPKVFIETIALSGIVLIVCLQIWRGNDLTSILPILALFALAAVRLMPSLTRIVSSMTLIRTFKPAVDSLHSELSSNAIDIKRPQRSERFISFKAKIEFKDLYFKYPSIDRWVLKNLNVTIAKGQSVAFVGTSGAGKTTLVDLLMGLFQPSQGHILVDGVDIHKDVYGWRENIGYVPQVIFLTDDSIRRNVAFGVRDEDIRDADVVRALKAAQLEEFVTHLPEGLETFVGERGIRLSGGQRQRLGVARALYHNPEVLVFDEATSALDYETEQEVTRAISSLSGTKTIILITHRLNTAATCDKVYKITEGKTVLASHETPPSSLEI